MASFVEHIGQARNNLTFLVETNQRNSTNWDWQVTIAFYVGVHLVNAHLATVSNWHFRAHEEVKNALYNPASPARLPQDIYLAYTKLENLSRRARYLCSDDKNNRANSAFFTYDKHFARAIKNLDKIMAYFKGVYNLSYPTLPIKCPELNHNSQLTIFTVA